VWLVLEGPGRPEAGATGSVLSFRLDWR
jgi:hypothetical protein